MKQTHLQSLYDRYKTYTDEQLREIINDSSYDDLTKGVAKDILNNKKTNNHQNQEETDPVKSDNKKSKTNTLYDDIHQIANDIHFIKNYIVVSIIIAFIAFIIGFIISNH